MARSAACAMFACRKHGRHCAAEADHEESSKRREIAPKEASVCRRARDEDGHAHLRESDTAGSCESRGIFTHNCLESHGSALCAERNRSIEFSHILARALCAAHLPSIFFNLHVVCGHLPEAIAT